MKNKKPKGSGSLDNVIRDHLMNWPYFGLGSAGVGKSATVKKVAKKMKRKAERLKVKVVDLDGIFWI